MSRQWAQKKYGSNSSMPVQKSSSWERPFTAPIYNAPAPKQTPSVQAKRAFDWSRVTVEAPSPAGVQAKLSVGAPGDKYEPVADAIANKVMTMLAPEKEEPIQREAAPEEKKEDEVQTKPLADAIAPLVQRETTPEEKEEEVQALPLAGSIQRETASEEKQQEEVQAKPAPEGKSQASGNVESQLSSSKGGGSPLSDEVRGFMEPRFGADFSSVRVHTDGAAVQMNKELGAQAFAHGSDIYFGAGKSPGNNELTAHELTHVVQQTGGVQLQAKLSQPEAWVQRYPDTSFEIIRMGLANSVLELGINQVIEKKKTKNDLLNEAFWMAYPEMNGKKINDVADAEQKQTYIDAYMHIAKTLYPKVYKQAKRTVEPKSDDTNPKNSENGGWGIDDIWNQVEGWVTGSKGGKKTSEDTEKIKPEDFKDLTNFEEGSDDITAEILESIREDLAEVGESPETWFNNFVDITFLGKTMKHPVHRILAAHLKNVEAKFVSQTGAKDPKEAAQKLGLSEERVAGGRTPQEEGSSTSMHIFGLAVDVDVTHNPWMAIPNEKDKSDKGGEEKWSNTYYGYMQELLGGERLEFKRDFNLGKVDGVSLDDRLTATIENVLKIDKMVESYFSLLEPEKDAKLQELLNKTTSSRWKGKTTEEARKQIQEDLSNCGKIWRRDSEKEQNVIRQSGITNLSEETIRGMDLYWGGMFGDLMHFDLRDRGIGSKVYQAALKHKKAQKKKKKEQSG
jgi:Domain of unknown function (DUF4157)